MKKLLNWFYNSKIEAVSYQEWHLKGFWGLVFTFNVIIGFITFIFGVLELFK